MNHVLQLIAAFTGCTGFALAYNVRGAKQILSAGFGGLAGWGCYLFFERMTGSAYLSGYLASAAVSAYSELFARILKMPATGLIIITAIPMIPGASLYRCMRSLFLKDLSRFGLEGTYTVLFASCMAAGFVTAAIVVNLIRNAAASGQ